MLHLLRPANEASILSNFFSIYYISDQQLFSKFVLNPSEKKFLTWSFIPPSAVYMRRGTRSALVGVMASRLFDANPLPEPVLTYNQLYPWEQTSVKL